MKSRPATEPRPRAGRLSHDYLMMLVMMLIVCIAVLRILTPDPTSDARPLWERVVSSFVGLLQCFGLCVLACVLLFSLEAIKQTASRYQLRRIEKRRERLEPLLRQRGLEPQLAPNLALEALAALAAQPPALS